MPAGIALYAGLEMLPQAKSCTIGQVSMDSIRTSTSYTCGFEFEDIAQDTANLILSVGECLSISEWTEQDMPGDASSTFLGQYGMFRLSFAVHPDANSVGFGVESFRDENGEVYGSPLRGNREFPDGRNLCTPKTQEQIMAFYEKYRDLDGAMPFENNLFKGFTNQVSSPAVAFKTRPSHRAHPAIIVRDITEIDGRAGLSAGGDFAGDCVAFQELLGEVIAMNQAAGQQ
ncbi:MAG: hypothetical protein AAGI14_07715 [Pseudomonadota bacterium]